METICVSPASFPGLCSKGKPRLLSAAKENGEGARLPHVKSLKKTRAGACWKKELPVRPVASGPRVHKNIYLLFSPFRFMVN